MAGQEALLLTNLAVALIAIRPLRRFIADHAAIFQILSLAGLAGFPDDYESHRLAYMSVATVVQSVVYASIWHSARDRPQVLEFQGRSLGIGLVATVVAKLAFGSLNPAWPFVDGRSGGHNAAVLVLAGVAGAEKLSRRKPPPKPDGDDVPLGGVALAPSIGFGALLFGLHQFVSDSGSIVARTWTGFPIHGPTPLPHGALVVAAMAAGLAMPFSLALHLCAVAGAAALHFAQGWTAFAGGLVFAAGLTSALPSFLRSVSSQQRPALAFFIAYLVYNAFVLADVRRLIKRRGHSQPD